MWPLIEDAIEGSQTTHLKENVVFLSALKPKVRLEDPKPEELSFFFVTGAKKEIVPVRDLQLQRVRASEEIIARIQLQLKYYIPGSYRTLSQRTDLESFTGQH